MNENKAATPQRFVINHFTGDDAFRAGFRANSLYRDLGVEAATNGLALAHVVRANGPFPKDGVSGPHRHHVHFQFCYVLKGWQTMRVAGVDGVVTAREGTSWIQPPGIVHEVLGYSDDREILEIILPAHYETVDASYDEPDALGTPQGAGVARGGSQ